MRTITPFLFSLFTFANSQAPSGTSVCDYYSAHLNPDNSTDAQIKWITQFVTNVFGGNSTVFAGGQVQGILEPATFNGTTIHLIKYFDGSLYATNSQSGQPAAVDWLDTGGIVALQSGNYANSNSSSQYKVFSHFGNLFARIMQCSTIGSTNFTSALQKTSLYQIHKYMALDPNELGYFIEQVGLAAQSVGLTLEEATTIKNNMDQGLTYRCRPLSALFPGGVVGPQSICTDSSCPLAPNYDCSGYDFDNGTSPQPQLVNGQPSSTSTTSAAPTSSASEKPTSSVTAAPSSDHKKTVDIAVGVAVPVGVIAFALLGFLFYRQRRKMATLENRLSRVEGGGIPGKVLGSNAVSDIDYSQPAMAPLGFSPNSRTPSQIQEPVVSQQYAASSEPAIPQQYPVSPDNRPLSWEHFKPVVQPQTNHVENESPRASIPFMRQPASIVRRALSPQEME